MLRVDGAGVLVSTGDGALLVAHAGLDGEDPLAAAAGAGPLAGLPAGSGLVAGGAVAERRPGAHTVREGRPGMGPPFVLRAIPSARRQCVTIQLSTEVVTAWRRGCPYPYRLSSPRPNSTLPAANTPAPLGAT